MADLIQVNVGDLLTCANTLEGFKGEHEVAITNIINTVNAIDGIWKGEASQQYINKMNEMKATFNAFDETLEQYIELIRSAASAFEAIDQQNATTISSF